MKSLYRFLASMALGALLCLAPRALGQGTVHNQVAGAGSNVLRYTPSTFLAFGFGPGSDDKGNGDKVCGGGNQGWGEKGGCHVPDGGAISTYLLLVGLCCLVAMVSRFRRRAGVRGTN